MNGDLRTKLQHAVALHSRGLPEQAASVYEEILRADSNHPDALHLLGVTETQLGRPREGLRWIAKSLTMNPDQPVALANQGNALLALDEPAAALASYDRALLLSADYPLAVYGRANALSALGNMTEALCGFDRTLALTPEFFAACIARGAVLLKLGRLLESLAAYDRAVAISPERAAAHRGRASAQLGLKAFDAAMRSIERALELEPMSADTFLQRGHIQSESGQAQAAIDSYDDALRLDPALVEGWFSRGLALSMQARFADAAASLRRALKLSPQHPYAQGACLHAELQVCDWHAYSARTGVIKAAVKRDEPADFPFSFLAVCDSPHLQLRCARKFAGLQRGPATARRSARPPGDRLRIAYISSDFLEHPTSYLAAGLFEKHDRESFETVAVSLREDAASPMARRVKASFDRVVEAGPCSDEELAGLVRDLGADIAVDLMGYTGEHRSGILTQRVAPLQVSYLGFPATMGTSHIDYLIADEFLIPDTDRASYAESIAYLPDCFQVNDDRRPIAAAVTRAQMGLPSDALIWCSFHSSYKLNPSMFDVWARLLRAAPDSVLWLIGGNREIEHNLAREAHARGVDPERRLVFAKPLPYSQHLARLALADLCLDTLPFNGGATTSDALWAGVPVVTCVGRSFAARMSGSLLQAVGLPELVTQSLQEYEQLASLLARSPDRLKRLRDTLAGKRATSPLFDTDLFRRHLERAYSTMLERHRQGLAPATFKVPVLAVS